MDSRKMHDMEQLIQRLVPTIVRELDNARAPITLVAPSPPSGRGRKFVVSPSQSLLKSMFGKLPCLSLLESMLGKLPAIPTSATKHGRFYLPDGTVVFLVEDTLFKVHRFFFERDSEHFKNILAKNEFSCGVPPEDRPVVLEDCTAVDFERFLSVLYPAAFDKCNATTLEEWTSILALSTQWSFATIRVLAIRSLFPLAFPIDKIMLGHTYGIAEWFKEAYVAICERPEALTEEEAERLGVKEVAAIARARERMRTGKLMKRDQSMGVIEDIFGHNILPNSPMTASTPMSPTLELAGPACEPYASDMAR